MMKKLLTGVSLVTLLATCDSATGKTITVADPFQQSGSATSTADSTPKVTGIGGIFFFSDSVKEMRKWYAKNLGIEINAWGSSTFESRNVDRPDVKNSLLWRPFKKGDKYFSPSAKDFMINYMVQNIEGLVHKLKDNGVTVLDSIATVEYGKFVHIMDAEGNKIELWEPVEGRTTK